MKARSDHVKEGLRKAYAAKVPGENLDVFCVSNIMYEKHVRKGNRDLVLASEIPEVRRFCYSITAEARHREALHLLQSSIPGLLHSLSLWMANQASAHDDAMDDLNDKDYEHVQDAVSDTKTRVCMVLGPFAHSAFHFNIAVFVGLRRRADTCEVFQPLLRGPGPEVSR